MYLLRDKIKCFLFSNACESILYISIQSVQQFPNLFSYHAVGSKSHSHSKFTSWILASFFLGGRTHHICLSLHKGFFGVLFLCFFQNRVLGMMYNVAQFQLYELFCTVSLVKAVLLDCIFFCPCKMVIQLIQGGIQRAVLSEISPISLNLGSNLHIIQID